MAIADVIKYEGDNSVFVYKHPSEDFNSLTQLIVHRSQEAVFMMNGQALDLFRPGRYTLKTENIPLVSKAISRMTGDENPFHCEVYFVNKAEHLSVKWGTDSRVRFMEPTYNFPVSIGAGGGLNLTVSDSAKLLVKVVGTEKILTVEGATRIFKSFLMTKVKSYLARTIRKNKYNIFEIDERLEELSRRLKEELNDDFEDYGMSLDRFYVTSVARPEGDPVYENFKNLYYRQYADVAEAKLRQQTEIIDAQTEAEKTIIESKALSRKRIQGGYTYRQERAFDVAQGVAENEGVGQFTNMGVSLGAMGAVGAAVGGIFSDALSGASAAAKNTSPVDNTESFKTKAEKLSALRERGLVTDEEFKKLKAELLRQIL